MSLYNDTSRTLTLQVTGIITKQSSRTPVFHQSSNTLIPPDIPFTDQNFSVSAMSERKIAVGVLHGLCLSCNTDIELVIKNGESESVIKVVQTFNLIGNIQGELFLRNTSNTPEPVHLIFA